ncbi:MAG: histidinol-phosphate transaminase [Acidimicrobiales bacterium]
MTIGRPRSAVDALPAYRPGKSASQAEAEHGIVDAIKLASNENPLPPVDPVVAAVARYGVEANRYADHRATALRQRLAQWLNVDVEMLTVGCGSVGLLQQLVLTYVDPGDEVVYPWRSFEVYPVFTQLAAGVAVTTPLTAEHAFDLGSVADAITDKTKLVLLANPNNPTGTALPTGDLATFLAGVPESTIVVIDEAYREFVDSALGDPVEDLVPCCPNVLVLRTFSKAHGMAGIRLGYAIGHDEVITAIDKTLVPFGVNGVAQAAALAAIDAIEEIRARVAVIVAERERVSDALVASGWDVPSSQANFVYVALRDRSDDVALGLERLGVVVRPFPNEGIRVTVGTSDENDRFLATLAEVASP